MNKRFLPIVIRFVIFIISLSTFSQQVFAQCPILNGFLVDSCDDGTGDWEGVNEMVVFHTGPYEYDLNGLTITFSSLATNQTDPLYEPTSGFCLSGCPTPVTALLANSAGATANNGFTVNPDRVDELNTINTACNDLLVSPTSNVIPPDATVLVFSGGSCWPEPATNAYFGYDFAAYCGNGPIYVIFKNDCVGQGKFTNSNNTDRTMTLSFGSVSDGCTSTTPCDDSYEVSYTPTSGGDGIGVVVSGTGATTGTLEDQNCNPPGFIPATGESCEETPPDVSITVCPPVGNNLPIDINYMPEGGTLSWYEQATGGTAFTTSDENSTNITYNGSNTSLFVEALDVSPASCNPTCRVEVPINTFPQTNVDILFNPDLMGGMACANQNYTLTAFSLDNITNFDWYIEAPDGTETTLAGPTESAISNFVFDQTGEYYIFIEVADENGCLTSTDMTVEIVPPPLAGFSVSDTNICEGQDVVLTNNSAPVDASTTYEWTLTNTTTNTVLTSTDSTPTFLEADLELGFYNVELVVNNADGCSGTLVIPGAFEVVALPNITVDASVTTDFTNCDGTFDYSSAVSPSGGTWSGGAFISSAGVFDPTGLAAGPYTITYTVGNLPCVSTEDIDINVTGGETVVLTQNSLDVCETTSLNLSDYVASGAGNWENENGMPIDDTVPYNLPDLTAPADINVPSVPTSIELTYASTNAACGNSETLTLNVFPYPDASTMALSNNLCNANNTNMVVDLDDFVIGTLGGSWACLDCPANTIDPATNIFNAAGLPPATYNIGYIVTGNAPCNNPASTSQTITIIEPTVTAGTDDEVCGLTYELNAITSGAGTWDILNTPAGGSASFVDATDPQTDVMVTMAGVYEFFWTVFDDACTDEDEVLITFSEQTALVITVGSLVLCTNDAAVTLSDYEDASSDAGTWEDELGNPITTFSPSDIAAGSTTQLTFSSGDGPCDDIEVLVVSVVAFDDVVLNDNSIFPCSTDDIINLNDYVMSGNGAWLDGNTTITTFDPSTAPTNTPIELIYTSGNADCDDQETLTITVQAANDVTLTQNTLEVCDTEDSLNLNDYVDSGNGNWTTGTNLIFGGNYDLTGATLDTPFDVYFTATGGNCADTDTLTITVTALNDVAIFPTSLDLCETDAVITLSDYETAGIGTWNNGIGDITTFDPSTAPTNSPIFLNFTSGTGNCDDTEVLTIVVESVVEVGLTDAAIVFCENAPSIDLSDYVANGTGSWSDGTNDNILNFDPSLQTAGTNIELYFMGDGDCADTDTLNISIEADNAVALTQNTVVVCNIDAPIVLADYVASGTGVWTNGVNTISTFDPSNAALNTTIELNFSSGNGLCDATETLSVTVEPYDEVSLTTNAVDICGNGEELVFADYENVGIGSWSDEAGNAIVTFDPSTVAINTNLDFYFTSANLLCADIDTLTVNITPFNDIVLTQPALDICSSDAIINLNDYVASGNGIWENAAGIEVTTFNPSTANVNIPILFTFSSNTGTCDDTEQLVITTTQAADAETNAPNNPQLCNNNLPNNVLTLNLDDLVTGNNSGVWTTDAPNSTINAGNVFDAEGLAVGSYTVTYTVQGTAPCGPESTTQTINVVECLPNCIEDATTTAPTELCGLGGVTLDLNTLLVNGVTTAGGTWSSPDVTILGNVFSAENLDGNYTITYTVTGSNGCPDATSNQTITVVAPPLAEINTPTIELCNVNNNTSFDLSNLVIGNSNGSWSCVENPAAVSGNIFDASGLNVGNYTIEYNVSANAPCTDGTTVSHTISVNEPITTTSNVTTCETAFVVSEPIPNMAGTWAVTGALSANISNAAAVQPTITFNDGIGNYELTWSSDNPTVCAETYVLNINYLAGSVPEAGADAIVCGSVYTLEGVVDAGENIVWSYTGTGSATLNPNDPQATVTVDAYGEYIFTLTLLDNNNCSVTDEVTIYFAPEPTANPVPSNTAPIAICGLNHFLFPYILFPGSPDNILPWPANLNGMWTYDTDIVPAPTVTFSPDETTQTVSVAASEYGTYTFYWLLNDEGLTIDDECGLANGWTVTFYPPINVDVATACADDLATYDVTLTITGGLEPYNINNNTIVGNVYTETLANSASASYAVDDVGVCSTININVQEDCNCDDIDAPILETFNPNYCEGTTPPTIEVTTVAGFTYNWYDNTTGNILASGNTFTPPIGSGNYAVQAVNDATTCTSFFAPFDIFEILLPAAPALANMTFCEGENIGILATASSPLNELHWEEAGGFDAGTNVNFIPNISAIGTYTYDIYEITADGCGGFVTTFTIEITENAIVPVFTNASFCSDETITVIATASSPNNTLFWSENNGNDTNSGNSFTPTVSDVGTYTYTIYENNAADCPSQTAVFTLEITDCACALEVSLAGNAFSCSGQDITLNGILNDPNNELDHLEWISSGTQANGNAIDFVATEIVTGCSPQTITYTLNAYCSNDPNLIASTATATVTYYPEPDAAITVSNNGCTLTATPNCAEFDIVGQNTFDFDGTETATFEVINQDAVGLGLNCTNTITEQFLCLPPTCNIDVTMPQSAIACSGDIVSLSAQVDNPNLVDHVEWTSSGTQQNGSVINFPASESVNGCDPLEITYTLSIFCTIDPTTAAFVGTTTVTYYPLPIANYNLSNNGCTITANPTCPNYSIVGDNPINFDGTETVSMTVVNDDAAGLGLDCDTNVFDATFICDPTINCPNIIDLTANNTELCSGDLLTLQLILDDETNLANAEWILDNAVVGNTTSVSTNVPTITTCEPQDFTYTVNIYCVSDPNIVYATQNIIVTVYPAFNPDFVNIVTSCEALATIEISCDNYIETVVQLENPTAGTNEVSWNITYNNNTNCFSEIASTIFDCAGCPSVNFALNNDTATCSGNLPNFEVFETSIVINDPQGTLDSFQWFSDAAMTTPVSINDVANNACEPSVIVFYVGMICTLEPTPIFAGTLNVTIYPAFNPAFITSTEGDCSVPQLTTSCDNYSITPIDVPTLAEASESGASGIATYEVTYDGSPSGVACFIEPATVAYVCGAVCPVAIINQTAPGDICSEETFILEVNVTPATAILGVDYSLQWQLNGTDINDADNISYQVNALNDNCEILTQEFSLVFTCLNPAGTPAQTIDAGTVNIYSLFDEDFVTVTNTTCEAPQIEVTCDTYDVVQTTTPTEPIETGSAGIAQWTVSNICFTEEFTANYNCPALACPNIIAAASENVSICSDAILDIADATGGVLYDDIAGTFVGFELFTDNVLQTPATPTDYQHSGSCEVEEFTLYIGMICSETNEPLPAGNVTVSVYPVPTTVTEIGGCSLAVQDNCGDLLVIEYLQIDGTWATTVPSENPANGETTSWIAYVAGADFNGDGDPNCFQTGVVIAVCDETCVPPATPTNILTNIEICDGETNTIPFEVGTPADVFVIWYNSDNEPLDTANVFTPTELDGYYALAYNVSDTCESILPIFASLDALPLEDAGFSYFADPQPTICIGDANILPNNIDTPDGTFSSPDALTIDAATGEITLDQAGIFEVIYTTNGQCPNDSTLTIIVTDCDSPCPIVTSPLDEIAQICDGETPDIATIEQNIGFDDPQNTFDGIIWFMDAALTEPLDVLALVHSGSCEVETISIFPALACIGENDLIAAGILNVELYPTPTSVTAVGGCSLMVQDNCGDLLIIEYLQADGTWATTVPNETPAEGETAEWQAYVLGADFDNDGVPNCFETGTVIAICNDDCVPPPAPLAVVDSLAICAGETNTQAFEMNSDELIIWYNAAGDEVANGTTFVPTEVGVYQAVAVLISDNTCSSDTTIAILESLENILSLELGDDITACESDDIILNAEISANANITWTTASGGLSNPNTATTNFTPSSTGEFMIYAIAENDCATSVSDSLLITVLPNIVLDISASSVLIEAGQEVQLTASGATEYIWQDDSSLSCTDCPNPVATPSQTTTYYVNTIDVNSCVTSANITIVVQESKETKLLVPNAFSPNSDGENDIFKAVYRGNLESFSFAIYNRWGKEMFVTDDFNEGWDGTYKGVEQEIGVYVYMIQYQFVGETADIKSGNVTLVR
ncbi:MAG: gliding motility-associated C-terminal domain-containing protein [Chitinophagales bacterium]